MALKREAIVSDEELLFTHVEVDVFSHLCIILSFFNDAGLALKFDFATQVNVPQVMKCRNWFDVIYI